MIILAVLCKGSAVVGEDKAGQEGEAKADGRFSGEEFFSWQTIKKSNSMNYMKGEEQTGIHTQKACVKIIISKNASIQVKYQSPSSFTSPFPAFLTGFTLHLCTHSPCTLAGEHLGDLV